MLVGVTKFGPELAREPDPLPVDPLSVAMLVKSEKAKVVRRAFRILEGLKKFGRE